jgi:FkbM family methyltransferase
MSGPQDPAIPLFNSLLQFRDAHDYFLSQLEGQTNGPAVKFLEFCIAHAIKSKSQLFQDLFVIFCKAGKRDGFFVEFGATNGVTLSNSYILEKELNWKGILAEPAKDWHEHLPKNRTAAIDFRCVWSKTGEQLEFMETPQGELSTIAQFAELDGNRDGRIESKTYMVETVSLNDLLAFHKAPANMDFLSIDTEGSELEILTAFDFKKYSFDMMCVEHNYTDAREKLRALLESKGYVNVFPALTQYDDWYLHKEFMAKLGP